ncbi:MAG: sigma-70 family RNA polymerase sigma factor [Dehalococcoidales bacterium]|nr:sigma-70 family RNA polymerase sigma factor [Dehalococcoidales bacterium]
MLFGTAYLMTRDRESAGDAVQNSLIQMWNHISSLRLRSSLKAWLLRIVVNEVNQQRRKKRLPTFSVEEVQELAGEPDEVETVAVSHERHQRLRKAQEVLPRDQREVVVMKYFSELTIPEIATVTGIREGTIKSRLSRALDKLSEILRNEEETGEAKR